MVLIKHYPEKMDPSNLEKVCPAWAQAGSAGNTNNTTESLFKAMVTCGHNQLMGP